MLELIGIGCLAVIVFVVTWRVTKPYCDRRIAEAQRAIDAGGVMIGFDITGPIVVPPEMVFSPENAKRWRAMTAATPPHSAGES